MEKVFSLKDICGKFDVEYRHIQLSRKGKLQCQDDNHKHILSILHNEYGFFVGRITFINNGFELDMYVKDFGYVGKFTLTKTDNQLWVLDKLS